MPVLLSNRGLTAAETGGQTGTVGEPSIAKRNDQILMTGNWYATRSSDGGSTWSLLNPFTFFPSASGGFCCDQTAIFEPSQGFVVWLLQYIKQNGTNTLRMAINRDPNMADNQWLRWDFQPAMVNAEWAGEWFDFNHAALSNNFLYVTTNAFRATDDQFTRCVVLRFPLAALATGGSLQYNFFQSTNFSLRCTQGAGGVMYFASHNSLQQIRVFTWAEATNQISQFDINVSPWTAGQYSAPCSDGTDWMSRCDSRMTAGYVASGEVGFMWTSNAGPNRPFPYVRLVRLSDAATPALVSQTDIFNTNYAYGYADASPNSAGEIGIGLYRGGGAQMPGHVVGVLDRSSGQFSLVATEDGTNGPSDNKWGDYLTCRRDSTDTTKWVAAGYTLQGGGGRDSVEPRYVRFGA